MLANGSATAAQRRPIHRDKFDQGQDQVLIREAERAANIMVSEPLATSDKGRDDHGRYALQEM